MVVTNRPREKLHEMNKQSLTAHGKPQSEPSPAKHLFVIKKPVDTINHTGIYTQSFVFISTINRLTKTRILQTERREA